MGEESKPVLDDFVEDRSIWIRILPYLFVRSN